MKKKSRIIETKADKRLKRVRENEINVDIETERERERESVSVCVQREVMEI